MAICNNSQNWSNTEDQYISPSIIGRGNTRDEITTRLMRLRSKNQSINRSRFKEF